MRRWRNRFLVECETGGTWYSIVPGTSKSPEIRGGHPQSQKIQRPLPAGVSSTAHRLSLHPVNRLLYNRSNSRPTLLKTKLNNVSHSSTKHTPLGESDERRRARERENFPRVLCEENKRQEGGRPAVTRTLLCAHDPLKQPLGGARGGKEARPYRTSAPRRAGADGGRGSQRWLASTTATRRMWGRSF